jgi:NADPH-ferrihemoprotein reductase
MSLLELLQDPSVVLGMSVGFVVAVCLGIVYSSSGSDSDDAGSDKTSGNQQNYPGGALNIYFGSQTGTAEGFARTLAEEGKAMGFDAKMCDLDDFEENSMKATKLAIFLMATYGEGEPTDNATSFYKWMKATEEPHASEGDLAGMKFCVFGLGNRQYEHFNRIGKTTNKNLEELGGTRVVAYAEGDDDGDLEADFDNWKSSMWPQLVDQFVPKGVGVRGGADLSSKPVSLDYQVVSLDSSELRKAKKNPIRHNQHASSTKYLFDAQELDILVNRELRNTSKANAGSTRHIELNLANTDLDYQTADNLAVLPQNPDHGVNALAKTMGYILDQHITIEAVDNSSKFKYPFPVPCTIKDVLTYYFDLYGMPKHSTIARLQAYVTDEKQRNWLKDLVSEDNHGQFRQYVNSNGRSIVDLLTNELNSCRIPLADLLHLLPAMQPRYYTISSSAMVHPTNVHITVSVTEYALPSGKIFKGLASSYLKGLVAGRSKCRAFIRPSTFRLPKSLATPICMIGPGTGIAPMRAFLQERDHQIRTKGGKKYRNTLYFGCKHANVDFIYKDELSMYYDTSVLTAFHKAFSRDQKEKLYVSTPFTYIRHYVYHDHIRISNL